MEAGEGNGVKAMGNDRKFFQFCLKGRNASIENTSKFQRGLSKNKNETGAIL